MTRRAESPRPAGEHDQPLLGAIGTPDAGEPAFRIFWGVDYDPEDVPAGVARADAAKKALGGATALIAYLKTFEKANELAAKRALYFGLIKLGWKPEDIAAFAGGSLRTLSPGVVMGRPMVP